LPVVLNGDDCRLPFLVVKDGSSRGHQPADANITVQYRMQ